MPQIPDIIREKLITLPGFNYIGEAHSYIQGSDPRHQITHFIAPIPEVDPSNTVLLGIKNLEIARALTGVFKFSTLTQATNREPISKSGLNLGRLVFTETLTHPVPDSDPETDPNTPNTPQWELDLLEILQQKGAIDVRASTTYRKFRDTEVVIYPNSELAELIHKYHIASTKGLISRNKEWYQMRYKIPAGLLTAQKKGLLSKNPMVQRLRMIPNSDLI